jgi:exonuclease III
MNNNRETVIFCHNIRGINSDGKHNSIRNKIQETVCDIICIQETKRESFNVSYLKKICPKAFDCFSFTPSIGASGGTIIIWKGNKLHGEVILENVYAQTVQFTSKLNGQKIDSNKCLCPLHPGWQTELFKVVQKYIYVR